MARGRGRDAPLEGADERRAMIDQLEMRGDDRPLLDGEAGPRGLLEPGPRRPAPQLLARQAEALLVELGVDPTDEPRPEADYGGAVAEQPQQVPLVGGPRIRLRDQPERSIRARSRASTASLFCGATAIARSCLAWARWKPIPAGTNRS